MRDLLTPTSETLAAPSGRVLLRTAVVAGAGFAFYGMTMGWWRSPLMGFYVAVKMPLLIALTLGCNGLLNGLLGILMGSGLGFRQSLHALLSGFAITGLILGSLAPVAFFMALNVPEADSGGAATAHAGYLLAHVVLIALGGVAGVLRLAKMLEGYCPSKKIARSTLAAWIAGNAFLGMQFSYVLRPFFGSPGLDVAFLRENPMQGSFYEAVWASVTRIFRHMPVGGWFWVVAGLAVAGIIFLKIRESKRIKPQTKL